MSTARNVALAVKANRRGAKYSLRIVLECRRANIPVSLGFAFIEQESGFRNVFGHDPVANTVKGGKVTRSRYREYLRQRKAGRGMQGVGPAQLTWYEFQDQADALGGCWVPRHNIRVGFALVASLVKQHGMAKGIEKYNGSGPAAVASSKRVQARQKKWHGWLG
jgi:hypothetical protein